MKEKLKSSAGFSLVEMLCAVAILLLLCVMLNSGLSMAMRSYFDLTAEAETQLLLNSLTNAIAGELRYTHIEIQSSDTGPVVSYNGGDLPTLIGGQVYVDGRELLPREKDDTSRGGAYKNGEYQVSQMDIAYDQETACFTLNLKVVWKNSGISAETPPEGVVIRCLNSPKEKGTL